MLAKLINSQKSSLLPGSLLLMQQSDGCCLNGTRFPFEFGEETQANENVLQLLMSASSQIPWNIFLDLVSVEDPWPQGGLFLFEGVLSPREKSGWNSSM